MLQPTWFDPSPEEFSFLESLQELSDLKNWEEWNTTRLIYADWLAERQDPREVIVRANWFHSGYLNRHKKRFDKWRVDLDYTIDTSTCNKRIAMLLSGVVINAYWLLHFAPGTLCVLFPSSTKFQHLRFTYCPERSIRTLPFDIGAHREGFLALFREPKTEF